MKSTISPIDEIEPGMLLPYALSCDDLHEKDEGLYTVVMRALLNRPKKPDWKLSRVEDTCIPTHLLPHFLLRIKYGSLVSFALLFSHCILSHIIRATRRYHTIPQLNLATLRSFKLKGLIFSPPPPPHISVLF